MSLSIAVNCRIRTGSSTLGGQRWPAPDQDGIVMRELVTNHRLSDGRIQRGERTRQALIKAYLDLLREKQNHRQRP